MWKKDRGETEGRGVEGKLEDNRYGGRWRMTDSGKLRNQNYGKAEMKRN